MKLTMKFVAILVLLLLASPLILLKGCGKALDGGPSGACPDTVAPSGSKISAPTDLAAPTIGKTNCYSPVTFAVTDASGLEPLNGICVEITTGPTDAAIALHTENDFGCNNIAVGGATSLVTRTDEHGNVSLDLVTLPTFSGEIIFVNVASGAVSATVKTAGAVAATP